MSEAITSSRALIIAGTGVSASAVEDGGICSWPGFLRSGLEWLRSSNLEIDDEILSPIESQIQLGEDRDEDFLLAAAQIIVKKLGGSASHHYATWLEDSVGSLKIASGRESVIDALSALNVPLATTNYDTLIEQQTGRNSADQSEVTKIRKIMTGESRDVAHLHGVWNSPSSVILTAEDYGRLLASQSITALRQSFSTLKVIIFVGFGASIRDPHFSSLRSWLSDTFVDPVPHFQLCRKPDMPKLTQERGPLDPVIPVVYGDTYEDLGPYLRSLRPSGRAILTDRRTNETITTEQLASSCRRRLLDLVEDSSVLPLSGRARKLVSDEVSLDSLLIEPSLLPLPPEQFTRR